MAGDFDWAERRQFLTSFFFFCLATRAFTLRRSASLPEQVSSSPAELSFFFFFSPFFPLLRTIHPWEPTGSMGTAECLLVPDQKRKCCVGREKTCQGGRRLTWTPVGRVPPLSQALPSAEQSGGTRGARGTGRLLVVPSGFSSLSWISFAAADPATTRLR